MHIGTIIEATPQPAKVGGDPRTLARVPTGQGSRGRIVRLGAEHVKLFNHIRGAAGAGASGELWSVAPLSADERAQLPASLTVKSTPAPGAMAVPAAAPAVKPRRTLPGYDVAPSKVAHHDHDAGTVKPSPIAAHVADLVSGYATEADERSDSEVDNSAMERKAATIAARLFRKLATDIRAGRVAIA